MADNDYCIICLNSWLGQWNETKLNLMKPIEMQQNEKKWNRMKWNEIEQRAISYKKRRRDLLRPKRM